MKELCGHCKKFASGKIATWMYMPADGLLRRSPFYCDDCVPRGCDCQIEWEDGDIHPVSHKEINDGLKDEKSLAYKRHRKDDEGRLMPCCEFDYEEFGFEHMEETMNEHSS